MTTKKNLVKQVLMSTLTAATFGFATAAFTACSDELDIEKAPVAPESAKTRSIDTPADKYNFNEMDPNENGNFDRLHWRNQTSIYLRVSSDDYADKSITDTKGRTGYQSVKLPWATSQLSCKTNLPNGFCDDITPAKGWELVANYCGEHSNPDAHYFVLYNKYMGKLRYFYYIPNYAKLNNAADHNFEIHMQKGMAEHSVFGYAVPTKRTLSDPDKINALQGSYLTQYVSPWTASVSKLGQLAPTEGWYAFDVDISVYRGTKESTTNTMKEDEHVQTTIRGYNSTNVDLYGKLNGDVNSGIKMKQCCVNNQSGVFGTFEDLLGKANEVKGLFDSAKDIYSNITSGNVLGVLQGGIGIAKQGCDFLGIDYGGGQSGFNGYEGDVNLKLTGTLDFKGKLQSENVIQGLSSITQPMTDYYFSEVYISSSGLRIVLNIFKHTRTNGHNTILKGLTEDVKEVFYLSGFLQLFITEDYY